MRLWLSAGGLSTWYLAVCILPFPSPPAVALCAECEHGAREDRGDIDIDWGIYRRLHFALRFRSGRVALSDAAALVITVPRVLRLQTQRVIYHTAYGSVRGSFINDDAQNFQIAIAENAPLFASARTIVAPVLFARSFYKFLPLFLATRRAPRLNRYARIGLYSLFLLRFILNFIPLNSITRQRPITLSFNLLLISASRHARNLINFNPLLVKSLSPRDDGMFQVPEFSVA